MACGIHCKQTLSVIFSRKSNPVVHPSLFMHDTIINETTNHKYVGLILSNNCSWTEHINSISDKAWARLNLMRTLKFRVSRRSLKKMYISYVRPLIEYSDSVWDNCSMESKNQLESIHLEAARVITGATKLCNIENFLLTLDGSPSKNVAISTNLLSSSKFFMALPQPIYRCGVFESRNHFFFTYPLYSLDRLRYLPANLDNLTSYDLLF